MGAAAIVLIVKPDTDTVGHFRTSYDTTADHAALVCKLAPLRATLTETTETQARRTLQQVRREHAALLAIDYFPGPAQTQSTQALIEAEAAVTRHFSPDEPQPLHTGIRQLEQTAYCGKV